MALKKVEIHITKYYLLAWIFGLVGLACQYYEHRIVALILYFFCFAYSIADYQTPPPDDDIEPPKGPYLDGDDNIKPS